MALILYRNNLVEEKELSVMKSYFSAFSSFQELKNSPDFNYKGIIIPRFRATPFPNEIEDFVQSYGFTLINSVKQHRYIANFDYYYDIEEYTPKTYFQLRDVPRNAGPYIVKGKTTSKKSNWNTQMFAPTIADVTRIYCELQNDYFIGSQGIIVREYEEFTKLDEGINDMPIIEEYRLFFLGKKLLSYGYYWSISEIDKIIPPEGLEFGQKIADIISKNVNYFVIDIARKTNGDFRVIEINDGVMAGLSNNAPEMLYGNLYSEVQNLELEMI